MSTFSVFSLDTVCYSVRTPMSSQPVNLTRVDVVGDKENQIGSKHLEALLAPLLKSSDKTLGQLSKEANKALENLQYSGLFQSVSVAIEDEAGAKPVDAIGEEVLNVGAKLNVEVNKLVNWTAGSVHSAEGNVLGVGYENKNLFDNGESLHALAMVDKREETGSNLLDLQFRSPMLDPSVKFVANGVYQDSHLKMFESSQKSLGFQLGLEKQKFCKCSGVYNVLSAGLAYHKRDVGNILDSASDEIKAYAGEGSKQSFFFNGSVTNMAYVPGSTVLGLNGMNLAFTNELTGMLATEEEDKFYKLDLDLQLAKSTPCNWITLTSGLQVGNIMDLSGQGNGTVHFQDKFYPHVPGSIAPVQPKGANGTLGTVGAMSYAKYHVGLMTKLGFVPVEKPIRAYAELKGALANAGPFTPSLDGWTHGLDAGVVYQTPLASARVFAKTRLESLEPQFGFEVTVDGGW